VTCAGGATRAGESAADVFAIAAACPAVVAVGVNCTDPADATALVPFAAQLGKPVVVYPNSGESWDADERRWVGPGQFAPSVVQDWIAAGARLVGGCCRVRPEDIALISDHVRRHR